MSADGNWNLVIHTPMGPRDVALQVVTHGTTFTGRATGPMGEAEVEGQVEGERLTWNTDITTPMPLKLQFDVAFVGDAASGSVKLGMLGNAKVAGERV
jgi:hypothetical protein